MLEKQKFINNTTKIQNFIKYNKGYLAKDIKIGNNLYCVKALDDSKSSFNAIATLYGNYYLNSFMLSITEMNQEGYQKKLDYILEKNKTDGFTYWGIFNQKNNEPIGLYGFKQADGKSIEDELDLTLMSKLGGIIKPVSQIMISFLFENFNIKRLNGNTLSYNQPSQRIAKQLGMVENGVIICDENYIRDSYLTTFVLTKDRYNQIKQSNNGIYKLLKLPNKIALNQIHKKARYLHQALKEFKSGTNRVRYYHCLELDNFRKRRFPYLYKKERDN